MAEVLLECNDDPMMVMEWVDVESVTFLNIEEDFEGRDVMTFVCPKCGNSHKSLVYK